MSDTDLPRAVTDTVTGEISMLAPASSAQVLTLGCEEAGSLFVNSADGQKVAVRKAVSCLVAPAAGDRVLATLADGHWYVLAVLERQDYAVPMRIETEGDLVLSARRVSIKTGVFDLVAEAANLVGDAFNSLFRTSKRVAGTDETIAQSTTVSAHERVSVIAGSDVHKAGVFSQNIESAMSQSAHTAVVTAKTDIRLNAERINVG